MKTDRVLIFLVRIAESAHLYLSGARIRPRDCDENSMTAFYCIVMTLHRTPMQKFPSITNERYAFRRLYVACLTFQT